MAAGGRIDSEYFSNQASDGLLSERAMPAGTYTI
jgi:hypothetical protein